MTFLGLAQLSKIFKHLLFTHRAGITLDALDAKLHVHPLTTNLSSLFRLKPVIIRYHLVDCCHLYVDRPLLPPRPGLTHPECKNRNEIPINVRLRLFIGPADSDTNMLSKPIFFVDTNIFAFKY